jgi:hypothetical protein
VQLPAVQHAFPPEGTGDSNATAFQSAIFSATLNVGPGGGSITFGGDDDMFLALNGNVVDEVGGVHPFGPTSTWSVGPGTYAMEIFYANRHVVDAFADIRLSGDITASVPEPSTWAMILIGFAGLGTLRSIEAERTGSRTRSRRATHDLELSRAAGPFYLLRKEAHRTKAPGLPDQLASHLLLTL